MNHYIVTQGKGLFSMFSCFVAVLLLLLLLLLLLFFFPSSLGKSHGNVFVYFNFWYLSPFRGPLHQNN